MHIPSCETAELCLPDFETALKNALLPNDLYDVRRWLYVPNQYTEYRYILGTRGQKPLICVGINPSTAAPDALDNTLKSVERIALYNGYDSFLMFNVYAQRPSVRTNALPVVSSFFCAISIPPSVLLCPTILQRGENSYPYNRELSVCYQFARRGESLYQTEKRTRKIWRNALCE